MKNILTEALVNSATNASFIFSYTNSAKLRNYCPFSYHFNFLRTPVLQYKCRAKQLIFQYSYIYNLIKRRGKQK